MKYKVGDEALVKARISSVFDSQYIAKCSCGNFYMSDEDIPNCNTDMTAEEAWEIAKKIEDMSCEKRREIFGTDHKDYIFQENTEKQAKAKIEAWEAEKEIKVGDYVSFYDNANDLTRSMYVTSKIGETDYCGICKNGDTYCVHKSALKKTGRHIDIAGILKKIGGG